MSVSNDSRGNGGLKRTPLYELHRLAGARLGGFAGWEMPVWYDKISSEHLAVRTTCGLFDISHMGQIEVTGPEALNFLQRITTNDLSGIEGGRAQYTLICDEDGGIIDDLIVYCLSAERCLLCVNASNTGKVFRWMNEKNKGVAEITDKSMDYGLLALQGPESQAILQQLTKCNLTRLSRFGVVQGEVNGVFTIIARTGYTGEDGFEIFLPWESTPSLWEQLTEGGNRPTPKPVGLGARDSLRLEMGYPLYGHEIGPDVDPYSAGLGWVVKMGKGDFSGKDSLLAIKEQGLKRRLAGLEMIDKRIPRQGYRILSGGREVGRVTSGAMSPSLKVPIAMGYLSIGFEATGALLEVEIRSVPWKARVAKRPFYKPLP